MMSKQLLKELNKNRELIRDYIEGYYTATEISNRLNCTRPTFIYNLKQVEPHAVEQRSNVQRNITASIVHYIENCIPIEYMRFNRDQYFGVNKAKKYQDSKQEMRALISKLRVAKVDLGEFSLIPASKIHTWYRDYIAMKYIEIGREKAAERLYKIKDSISERFYKLKKFWEENDNRFTFSMSEQQEQVFLENIEIYERYKGQKESVEKLAETYNRDEEIVDIVIELFTAVEQNFQEKKGANKNS